MSGPRQLAVCAGLFAASVACSVAPERACAVRVLYQPPGGAQVELDQPYAIDLTHYPGERQPHAHLLVGGFGWRAGDVELEQAIARGDGWLSVGRNRASEADGTELIFLDLYDPGRHTFRVRNRGAGCEHDFTIDAGDGT